MYGDYDLTYMRMKDIIKTTSPKEYGEYLAKKSKRKNKNKKHSIGGYNRR